MALKDTLDNFTQMFKWRNETHIANAYAESDYCWVWWGTEELFVESIVLNANASGNAKSIIEVGTNGQVTLKTRVKHQGVRVVPWAEPHKIYREMSNKYIYVTVMPMGSNGQPKGSPICIDYKVDHNRSYIITQSGGFVRQAMGKNLWQDETNYNHKDKKYVRD